MSITFLLSGRSSILESTFSPPIILEQPHEIGLVNFAAYNSIPNVDNSNQYFYYGDNDDFLVIPKGAYEIENIESLLQEKLGGPDRITIKANNSTLKCKIKSDSFKIDFSKPKSIGPVLGFGPRVLAAGEWHESDLPINIMTVNMVRVECNVAVGSYVNGTIAHTIFAFSPPVPPGFKMILSPQNIIYNRVNADIIDRLSINIVDQDGKPVDFGGEEVTVRLHLRSLLLSKTNG